MTESIKVYVFFHSLNANVNTITNAYESALEVIEQDGGTVMTVSNYPAQGDSKVAIIYKSSKSN